MKVNKRTKMSENEYFLLESSIKNKKILPKTPAPMKEMKILATT